MIELYSHTTVMDKERGGPCPRAARLGPHGCHCANEGRVRRQPARAWHARRRRQRPMRFWLMLTPAIRCETCGGKVAEDLRTLRQRDEHNAISTKTTRNNSFEAHLRRSYFRRATSLLVVFHLPPS